MYVCMHVCMYDRSLLVHTCIITHIHTHTQQPQDEILATITGYYEDKVFSQTNESSSWFSLGQRELVDGLEMALVREGVKGGKFNVTLAPEYAFGEEGWPPLVPPNAEVKYSVELHVSCCVCKFVCVYVCCMCLCVCSDVYAYAMKRYTYANTCI